MARNMGKQPSNTITPFFFVWVFGLHHTIDRILSKWWDYKICLNCGSWNWYENRECVNCQGDQFRKASRKDAEKLNDSMADVDIFNMEMDV